MTEPDWQLVSREMKRKSVTLLLLWQEYREAHPGGFGYTRFCDKFGTHAKRANPTYRHRHAAGALVQTDYAGQTIPLIDPDTGEVHDAQLFVAVLGASSYEDHTKLKLVKRQMYGRGKLDLLQAQLIGAM